ncbi:hypothetical protein [uncultured Litoreibacter sp.]|uniref:DUF7079 family protein n=1 Tax=uncultured Litoreibacter sp. TaxID=1392394 RepID=UPI002635DA58|nr:hypothetical protein [uncultured Litoreibacter sp.]
MNDTQSARERVWINMSELFLDTDISDELDYIASALAASPFDEAELDRILLEEVYPVCIPNLHSIAGIWSGFDEAELVAAITRRNARKFPLLWLWMPFRRRHMRRMLPEWEEIRDKIAAIRAG